MTFYQELKEFFKTNDPQRLYMAKTIASKFRKGTEQKVVLNRLKIVYDNGGPSNIILGVHEEIIPELEGVVEETVNDSVDENSENQASVEVEIEIEGATPEVEIDIPDDEENKEG